MADRVGRHSGTAGSFDRNSSCGIGGNSVSQYWLERDGQKILVTRYSLQGGGKLPIRGTSPYNARGEKNDFPPQEIARVRAEIPVIPISVPRETLGESVQITRDAVNGRYFRADRGSL